MALDFVTECVCNKRIIMIIYGIMLVFTFGIQQLQVPYVFDKCIGVSLVLFELCKSYTL